MNAKEFLESKVIFSLDTKKRYNEVISWMEEYHKKESEILHSKLSICKGALKDIANWDDEMEKEWSDQGDRAIVALDRIKCL